MQNIRIEREILFRVNIRKMFTHVSQTNFVIRIVSFYYIIKKKMIKIIKLARVISFERIKTNQDKIHVGLKMEERFYFFYYAKN